MSLEQALADNTAALLAFTASLKGGLLPTANAATPTVEVVKTSATAVEDEAPKETAKEAMARKAAEKKAKLAEIEAKALADRTNDDLVKQTIADSEAEDGSFSEELPNLHPDEPKNPAYFDKYVKAAVNAAAKADEAALRKAFAEFTYEGASGTVVGIKKASDPAIPSVYWDSIILVAESILNPVEDENDYA